MSNSYANSYTQGYDNGSSDAADGDESYEEIARDVDPALVSGSPYWRGYRAGYEDTREIK